MDRVRVRAKVILYIHMAVSSIMSGISAHGYLYCVRIRVRALRYIHMAVSSVMSDR